MSVNDDIVKKVLLNKFSSSKGSKFEKIKEVRSLIDELSKNDDYKNESKTIDKYLTIIDSLLLAFDHFNESQKKSGLYNDINLKENYQTMIDMCMYLDCVEKDFGNAQKYCDEIKDIYEIKYVYNQIKNYCYDDIKKIENLKKSISNIISLNLHYLGRNNRFNDKKILELNNFCLSRILFNPNKNNINNLSGLASIWLYIDDVIISFFDLGLGVDISYDKDEKVILSYEEFWLIKYVQLMQNKIDEKLIIQNENLLEKEMDIGQKILEFQNLELEYLCEILHITQDTKFSEIIVRDWFFLFFNLRNLSREISREPDIFGFGIYGYETFCQKIRMKNMSDEVVSRFIDLISFHSNSVDLYESPIVRLNNSHILLFSSIFNDVNLAKTFLSCFSKNNYDVKEKGGIFEKNLFDLLKDNEIMGFRVFNVKKTFDDEEYEYDAILIWGNFVFILEAKNQIIRYDNLYDLFKFNRELQKNSNQVRRLKNKFENKIDEFSKDFHLDLKGKTVIPIVVNALPFVLDFPYKDVFFIDFDLLKNFFNSDRYKGSNFNESDFINAIKEPYGIKEAIENLKFEERDIEIGNIIIKAKHYI